MKCDRCARGLRPDFNFCPWCGQEVLVSISDTDLEGAVIYREAFALEPYRFGFELSELSSFYGTFVLYILATSLDIREFVHYRRKLVSEMERNLKGFSPTDSPKILWCALSLVTERYFAEKSKAYDFTEEEEKDLKSRLYSMLTPAFKPSGKNQRLEAKIIKQWRDDLLALQVREFGPLPACAACTSKCIYRYDVQHFLDDELKQKFEYILGKDDNQLDKQVAWFSSLTVERLTCTYNLDLSYCVAANLLADSWAVKEQVYSSDKQAALMERVRAHLEEENDLIQAASVEDPQQIYFGPELASRDQRIKVMEMVCRRAIAGAPWKQICAQLLTANGISEEEVEAELRRREEYNPLP